MFVRKIISQSTVDGPGNRTAIFLQGCNIRCAYCHNPETQPLARAMLDIENKEKSYDILSAKTHDEIRDMSVDAIVAEVRKCMPFIRGITVSGGECMLQASELALLFEKIKSEFPNLSCLIDSNGTIPFALHQKLTDLCDGVMLDVKAWQPEVYKSLTSASNDGVVKDNLRYLLEKDKLAEVRIVCLPVESPVVVDVECVLEHLAQTGVKQKRVLVKLLRFRPNGVVGQMADLPSTSDSQMLSYLQMARALGLNAVTSL